MAGGQWVSLNFDASIPQENAGWRRSVSRFMKFKTDHYRPISSLAGPRAGMLESRTGSDKSSWRGILLSALIRRTSEENRDTVSRQSGLDHRRWYRHRPGHRAGLCAGRRGVAVAGRRLEKAKEVADAIEKQGGAALPLQCDVSRAKDAERATSDTAKKFGKLNVLVNNAGTLSVSTVATISEDDWDRVITTNLKGPFLMSRAALREFRKNGGGTIVNVGSVLGLVAMKDRAAYCASKGGVTMLTKAMALDHAHENVRVNCICPSIVETELVKGLFDDSEQGKRLKQSRMGTIPLGRFGKPADVADLAVFLASEESSWLTGGAIPLDGGLTAF